MARIAKLEKEVTAFQRELDELQEKSGRIEQDIKDLEKKILEVGGSKLLTQKSKVDGLRLHINLTNDEITKAEVAKSKAEKDVVKLESSVERDTEALGVVDQEIETLDEEIRILVEYIEGLRKKVEDAQSAVENSKEDLDGLKADLVKQEDEISEFKQTQASTKEKPLCFFMTFSY